jgi:hypothetical protein
MIHKLQDSACSLQQKAKVSNTAESWLEAIGKAERRFTNNS